MVNSIKPQNSRNVFQNQSHPSNRQRPRGGVRQDKYAFERVRIASAQPVRGTKDTRTRQSETKNIRSKNRNVPKRQTVLVGAWVKPRVKEELQRIADAEGLTISAVSAAFLERALQQNIDMQYGALLKPIIEQTIAKQMQGMSTRLAWLLVRVAFDIGQVRGMTTNILGRQPGMNQEILETILKESGNTAKANITRRTPQLKELMEILEKWLQERESDKESN